MLTTSALEARVTGPVKAIKLDFKDPTKRVFLRETSFYWILGGFVRQVLGRCKVGIKKGKQVERR